MDREAARALAESYTAAWNSGDPQEVARHYSELGRIVINMGDPHVGREGVAAMAAGFFGEIPDLHLACDAIHVAGSHMAYFWTFTGTHAGSGRSMAISGWEEWDIGPDGLIANSRGWFDGPDYARQAGG